MSFKRYLLESLDKSLRRKLQRVIEIYLKRRIRPKSFTVQSNDDFLKDLGDGSWKLFGTPTGFTTHDNQITVPEDSMMSAMHELLHTTGFMDDTTSNFWNEAITQIVAEDIAQLNNIKIPLSYVTDVNWVRKYFISLINMPIREFAITYSTTQDKALFMSRIIWKQYSQHFVDEDDWGSPEQSFENLYESFQRALGPGNPRLEYLVDEVG